MLNLTLDCCAKWILAKWGECLWLILERLNFCTLNRLVFGSRLWSREVPRYESGLGALNSCSRLSRCLVLARWQGSLSQHLRWTETRNLEMRRQVRNLWVSVSFLLFAVAFCQRDFHDISCLMSDATTLKTWRITLCPGNAISPTVFGCC